MHAFTSGDDAELLVAERSSLRADGEALAFITEQVVDGRGRTVPLQQPLALSSGWETLLSQ